MKKIDADIKADMKSVVGRSESLGLMEPLTIRQDSRNRGKLIDLAMELTAKAAGFRRSLPKGMLQSLSTFVRSMNCYYSNLIEGHDTHPIEIERALKNDYSADTRKRDLQFEAKAHINVQAWIDEGGLLGRATSADGLLEIHKRFGELLPEALLWIEEPDTGEKVRVIPGELRVRDVKVGRHVPVSPGSLPRFLERFEKVYSGLSKSETILAVAATHHRLLWIHPFVDGNGRVARLMSHAILLETLDTGAIWSIARGLARNESAYKTHLVNCDLARRNDLDGRGHLSEESLVEFTDFFLQTCIDQVDFMESLVQPDRLRYRILVWAGEEVQLGNLPLKSEAVLEGVLYRGEVPRGEVPALLGVGQRQARRVVSALVKHDVLISATPRAPLRLSFPAQLASIWMPGLFPDK